MGICCSDADDRTREYNRQLAAGERLAKETIKLLFLGTGGSGKSTLFKQLRLLHGDGLGLDERRSNTANIYRNVMEGMKLLVEGNYDLHVDDEKNRQSEDQDLPKGVAQVKDLCNDELADFIGNLTTPKITLDVAERYKKAWTDPGIVQTWANRSKLQVQDSLMYFMENIDRIAQDDYIPSKDDVLHVRSRTSGIIEETLKIEGRPWLIVDVGGQRSERRKWATCFEDVTGLIYVASLAAYNQLLFEDETTNRMEESLKIFESTLDIPAFRECCIILFLNKSDLFKEKIEKWPITSCFVNYNGPFTEKDQYDHIRRAFESKNMVRGRKIHVHRTCATNTDHIKGIFNAVNQKMINQALIRAGLIVRE